jgi:zinc transport system substrate-binding protein
MGDKLLVVTTLFPLYDFTRQVAGEKAEVSLLLPPGVEPHTFEPTPQDAVRLGRAGLFVYTGDFMEPWAKDFLGGVKNPALRIVNASTGIELLDENEEHHDEEGEHREAGHEDDGHHDAEGKDPHIWLDPRNALIIIESIRAALADISPQNEKYFSDNAATLSGEIKKLDADIEEAVKGFKNRTIVSGGHFAFGYFAKRYGLNNLSPYLGFSPNAEPTPQRIIALVKALKDGQGRAVYFQELINPKVAEVIAKESGAELLLLHGAGNVGKDELAAGVTYLSIMRQNLENLKKGLN